MTICPDCGMEIITNSISDDNLVVCSNCGTIIRDYPLMNDTGTLGSSQPSSNLVRAIGRTFYTAKNNDSDKVILLSYCEALSVPQLIQPANLLLRRCLDERKIRKSNPLFGVCVYLAAKQEKLFLSLKNVATICGCSHFVLGALYNKICQELNISNLSNDPYTLLDPILRIIIASANNMNVSKKDILEKCETLMYHCDKRLFFSGKSPRACVSAIVLLALFPMIRLEGKALKEISLRLDIGASTLTARVHELVSLLKNIISVLPLEVPSDLSYILRTFFEYSDVLLESDDNHSSGQPEAFQSSIRNRQQREEFIQMIKNSMLDKTFSEENEALLASKFGSTALKHIRLLLHYGIPSSLLTELSDRRLAELVENLENQSFSEYIDTELDDELFNHI